MESYKVNVGIRQVNLRDGNYCRKASKRGGWKVNVERLVNMRDGKLTGERQVNVRNVKLTV